MNASQTTVGDVWKLGVKGGDYGNTFSSEVNSSNVIIEPTSNITNCQELQDMEFDLTKDKKLSEMSYGQKKKFLVAFGIATNCNLLILDEPTNGLDIPSKSQFRKLLAKAICDEKRGR